MKVSIIVPDNYVIIDGMACQLDLTSLGVSPAVHAVQADEAAARAELEWVPVVGGMKPPNVTVSWDEFLGLFGPVLQAAADALRAQTEG